MIVIEERRRDGDAVGCLLGVAFGAAAWRGASDAPVLASLMGALSLVAFGGWIRWRCRPPRRLTIATDEITWGRPGDVRARIPRTAAPLELRRGQVVRFHSTWWLGASPGSGAPGISMLGFDLDQVRRACHDRGWEFGN
jgi:hypothetical protein